MKFEELKGKVFTKIDENGYSLVFHTKDNAYQLYHEQDCCEEVYIEDIVGDLNDLIGYPILMAEEVTSHDNPLSENEDSFTWTFYKLATIKGYVTLRWINGNSVYYSVKPELYKIEAEPMHEDELYHRYKS